MSNVPILLVGDVSYFNTLHNTHVSAAGGIVENDTWVYAKYTTNFSLFFC